MNPVRSVAAVLAGVATITLIVEPLEFTLVNALAGGTISTPESYFDVRNRPPVLAAKVVYNTLAAVLAGYVTARLARVYEIRHAAVAAALQTAAFVNGMTRGEYAATAPMWLWTVLVLVTGPGMLLGAWVRAQAGVKREDSSV